MLNLPHLREVGAKWVTNAASYISDNPQIVVNGFVKNGIIHKLDSSSISPHGDALGEQLDVPVAII